MAEPARPRGGIALPPALLLAAAASSWWLYNHSPPPVANRVIYVYAACLVAGPSLVYPWMRRRGASVGRAAAGALVVPLAWLVKEGARISAVFSVPEAFYYALNPMALGLYAAIGFQLSVWEFLMRRPWSRGWRLARGPALALVAVIAYFASFTLVGRESGGSEVFYNYVAIHARLFGE